MKTYGKILQAIGLIGILLANFIDTSVPTKYGDVYNFGLMSEKTNLIIISAMIFVAGIILYAFGRYGLKGELPKEDKKKARYLGERNTQSGPYQLFLTEKYSIHKNATLEKYVVGDNLFETLDDAVKYADTQDKIEAAQEQSKDAIQIFKVDENSNAYLAGIKVKDVVVAYNGNPISCLQELHDAIESASEPTTKLTILRLNVFEKAMLKEFSVKSGELGINGSIVSLDNNAYKILNSAGLR